MANELEWQRRIIKQVEKEGGYGKKWASPYTVGVPDLILSLPGAGLVLAEVKLETDWNKNTERTIELTDKQGYELNKFRDAGAKTCVLVVVDNKIDLYVSMLPVPCYRAKLQISRAATLEGAFEWRYRGQRSGFIEWVEGELKCQSSL